MAGAKRRQADRAIIYGAILGGLSLEDVNGLLKEVGARELPKASFDSIRASYLPYFERDFRRLGAAIKSPPTWTAIAAESDPTEEE